MKASVVSYGFNSSEKSSFVINNNKECNFISWFASRPIVSFNNEDSSLIYGSPDYKRKFLDLVCSQIDSNYLSALIAYKYWVSSKNSILNSNFNSQLCDIYDEKIADYGSYLVKKRIEIFNKIHSFFNHYFITISETDCNPEVIYNSFFNSTKFSIDECKNVFYRYLVENRKRDLSLGFTTVGPHRDNYSFFYNTYEAKKYCSQGQCRALSLSFKLSISEIFNFYCKESVIYLIDDTVAELDIEKTRNFFPLIEGKGQIFIASPKGKSFFSGSHLSVDF